jgi:hypothetical protein
MIIPIKKMVLEESNKFFDNIANGKRNTSYSKKDFEKDKNILKFSGVAGGLGGALAGATVDSFIDGNEYDSAGNVTDEESSLNGAALGGLLGVGTIAAYGLNNNHEFINRDKAGKFYDAIKQKILQKS